MATDTIVSTKQGRLKGVEGESVKGDNFLKFLGIPYAKPPIGELRFKAPVPADPWQGERDAIQESNPSLSYDTLFAKQIAGSEDCLYLNVFTRGLSSKDGSVPLKPVMVWIHGGAFTVGSSSTLMYAPEVLMTKDIVLVTINYRLGILGFLSLEDTSLEVPGNAGLKDQVMALKWVQENIESFGGDPKNVTIFGSSAGGASVHLLYLSPLAKGLFHRAIAMSGSALNPWVWGTKNVKQVAKVLGKDVQTEGEALKVLEGATGEQLIEAQVKFTDNFWDSATIRPFSPVVERPNPSAFLSREPRDIIASGEYNQVPFMTGMVEREGLLIDLYEDGPSKGDKLDLEEFVPIDLGFKKDSEGSKKAAVKINQHYSPETNGIYELCTDTLFARGIIEGVERQMQTSKQPVYLYVFTVETKLAFSKNVFKMKAPGVCHGDEVCLLFPAKVFDWSYEKGSIEEKSVERLVTLFTNFAKYGNPTPLKSELDVEWTPVENPATLNYLDIGEELEMKVSPIPERMAFWKDLELNVNSTNRRKDNCNIL